MKKLLITLTILIGMGSWAFAQDQTATSGTNSFVSKNGHQVLPQSGDFAITAGATTMLRYLGDFFGFTGNNTNTNLLNHPNKNLPASVIGGKYLLSSELAIRGALNLYYNNSITNAMVNNDLSTNPDDFLYDRATLSQSGLLVAAGLEMRRGSSRVQGVYGAEVYYGSLGGLKTQFDYANDITQSNQEPTSTNWWNSTMLPPPSLGYRIKEQKLESQSQVGLRLFAGVEYFIAPKVSLGGEFYWGVGYSWSARETLTFESYNPLTTEPFDFTVVGEGVSSLDLGISNIGGLINLNFYF